MKSKVAPEEAIVIGGCNGFICIPATGYKDYLKAVRLASYAALGVIVPLYTMMLASLMR